MTRSAFYIATLVAVLLAIGGNTWLGVKDARETQRGAHHACHAARVVASITSETLQSQIQNSKRLLPKISFPGLTKAQLIEVTVQKEVQERQHLVALEAVARESCN